MLFFIARYIKSPAAAETPPLHRDDLFLHTILPGEISTLFIEALEKFDPISGQPTDSYISEIREVLD